MKYDPDILSSVPPEIIEAAKQVEYWMKQNGHTKWKLMGIQSRDDFFSELHNAMYPVPLNSKQESLVKQWAEDDRLWTTQETVQFNLGTFARSIIAAQ